MSRTGKGRDSTDFYSLWLGDLIEPHEFIVLKSEIYEIIEKKKKKLHFGRDDRFIPVLYCFIKEKLENDNGLAFEKIISITKRTKKKIQNQTAVSYVHSTCHLLEKHFGYEVIPIDPEEKGLYKFSGEAKGKDFEWFCSFPLLDPKSGSAEKPTNAVETKQTKTFQMPFFRPYLEGRIEDLTSLRMTLQLSSAAITGTAALTGQGGLGKTQLAVEYAYRYQGEYNAVFWLPGQDPELLIQTMAGYALDLGIDVGNIEEDFHRHTARLFFSWLRNQEKILLIVDDIHEATFLVKDIPGLPQCCLGRLACSLLATTRLAAPVGVAILPLKLLSVKAACRLLINEAEIQDSPDVEIVIRLLGRLPLAIRIAAGFLKFSQATLSNLIDILRTAGVKDVEFQTSENYLPFDYNRPIKALLEESCQTLKGAYSQYAIRLLQILALLPVNRIHSSELIQKILPLPSFNSPSHILFHSSITLVRDRNLLEVTEQGGLRLHPIIHHLLQVKIPVNLGKEIANQAIIQYRNIIFLSSLDVGNFFSLSQSIPLFFPLADFSTRKRLKNLSKLIDLQFHAIQMGGEPLAQLHFQAKKFGDEEFSRNCEQHFQKEDISRLVLKWTTAKPSPALMRVLVSMSHDIFGCGIDQEANLICSLVNGGDDRDFPSIRLWSVAGNDPDNPFSEKEESFQICSLSQSGRSIVTLDTLGYARKWDPETGVERCNLQIYKEDEFSSLELWSGVIRTNNDGNRCLAFTRFNLWFFDFERQKVINSWSIPKDQPFSLSGDLSADGKCVLLHDGRGFIMIDPNHKTESRLRELDNVKDFRLSQVSRRVVMFDGYKLFLMRCEKTMPILREVDISSFGPPFCFSIDAAADHALVGYTNGLMILFHLESAKPLKYILEPGGHVKTCLLDRGVRYCLSESMDSSLRLWDLSEAPNISLFQSKTSPQMMCAFSRTDEAELLVTLDLSGYIRIWDVESGHSLPITPIKLLDKDALAGSISSDGSWVCVIGQNGRLHAFNPGTSIIREWNLPKSETLDEIQDAREGDVRVFDETDLYIVSCQSPWVIVMIGPKEIFVSNLDYPESHHLLHFDSEIGDLEMSPCGDFFAVALQKGIIEIFIFENLMPKRKQLLQSFNIMVQKICIAPKGRLVALGVMDSHAHIINMDAKMQNSFEGTTDIIPIEFSRDGEQLLMIEGDDRIVIASSFKTVTPVLDLFVGNVRYARMNSEGTRLAVLGHDGSIYLFDILTPHKETSSKQLC